MFNPESVFFPISFCLSLKMVGPLGPWFLFLFLYMGTLSRFCLAAAHWDFWNRLGDHDEQRVSGLL